MTRLRPKEDLVKLISLCFPKKLDKSQYRLEQIFPSFILDQYSRETILESSMESGFFVERCSNTSVHHYYYVNGSSIELKPHFALAEELMDYDHAKEERCSYCKKTERIYQEARQQRPERTPAQQPTQSDSLAA